MIQVDSEEQLNQFFPSQKCFNVPRIFMFKSLVPPAKDVKGNGEVFDKLKLALICSSQQPVAANLDLLGLTAIKNVLANSLFSATSSNKQISSNQNFCQKLRLLGDSNEII